RPAGRVGEAGRDPVVADVGAAHRVGVPGDGEQGGAWAAWRHAVGSGYRLGDVPGGDQLAADRGDGRYGQSAGLGEIPAGQRALFGEQPQEDAAVIRAQVLGQP